MDPTFKHLESLVFHGPGSEALTPLPQERENLLDLIGLSRDRVRDEDNLDVDNDPRGNLFALIRTRHDYGTKLISRNEYRHFMSPASLQHLDRMIVIHSEIFTSQSVRSSHDFNLGLLYAAAAEFRGLKHDLAALPEPWAAAYEDVQTLQELNEASQ